MAPLKENLRLAKRARIGVGEVAWENTGERRMPVARPRYQRGYVRLRGTNYELRYREDVADTEGNLRRVQRSVVLGPMRNKKEARRAAEVYMRPFNSAARQPQVAITLGDFWSRYFEPEILPTVKFSTRKMYRCLGGKHLLPYFGGQNLSEITRVQVQQFIGSKQRQGYATETLGHFRDSLSKILETARSWGWLQDNVARGVKLPPMERRREARVLSPEEIGRLLPALPEPSKTVFALGIGTGLRIGELLGLYVRDVDFSTATLYVRRAVYRGQVGSPKTRGSERQMPLASIVVHLLQTYLSARRVESEWLFPSDAGTTLDDRNLIRRQVQPTCDRLGIRRFSWHSLRHTFSTIAGNGGMPLPLLQSLLGHTSLDMTMLYAHPVEESKRQAIEKVAAVLCPNVPNFGMTQEDVTTLVQ